MSGTRRSPSAKLIDITGKIASAHVAHNHVSIVEISTLLNTIHEALVGLADGVEPIVVEAEINKPTPVQIRKSVGSDGIMSFIDGKTYKTLKRHLTSRGLDPKSYRDRYGLPSDYPMVAPSYAEQRSALAKAIGLGKPGAMAESALRRRKASY